MKKGIGGTIEGMVALIIAIFTFAVSYPVLDQAINTLQASAGTTVDIISAGYLPIMAIILFVAIVRFLQPGRPASYDYA